LHDRAAFSQFIDNLPTPDTVREWLGHAIGEVQLLRRLLTMTEHTARARKGGNIHRRDAFVPMKEPVVIHPDGVYSMVSLQAGLGLTKSTVAREIRLGRLLVAKRAGRYFILGQWILDWLRAGEIRKRPRSET
jgi:hypothetical protein